MMNVPTKHQRIYEELPMSLLSSGSPIGQVIGQIMWLPISMIVAGVIWIAVAKLSQALGSRKGTAHAFGVIAFALVAIIGIKFMSYKMESASKLITNQPSTTQMPNNQTVINISSDEMSRRKEAYWRAYNQKEDDCRYPSTGNQVLECQRREENRRHGFEVRWKQQIQAGWVPAEVR
jgi:hypothetical protein